MSEKKLSFFQQTLFDLGVSSESIKFKVEVKQGAQHLDNITTIVRENILFDTDDKDNFIINYYKLNGLPYDFRKEGNKWPINYKRTRLKIPLKNKDGEDIKYLSPADSGLMPFFPPKIISKYMAGEEIELLIITEGEKKAFKGCMCGLDVVGIPSIHGFYNGDIKGKLHEDIQDLIIVCKVKKIIYLTDADTLAIKWKKDKDLHKRQATFYQAVKLFRESVQLLLDDQSVALTDVYFSHINIKYIEDGKGLDDLLNHYSDKIADIIEDLLQFQFAKKYFSGKIISDGKTDKIYKYFALSSEEEFYSQYKTYIGSNEFLFKGRLYEYDGEKVKYVRHRDADKYMRIGADWLKVIKVPNKYSELEEEIIPYKIGEILRDYKQYPFFIEQIPRYDAFCNEPAFTEVYKRVHNGCYNLCNPISHKTEYGLWPHTYKFLKHIFSGEGLIKNEIECGKLGDIFTVGLDWLTITFRHPKQMVPVPILVSKEFRTGKSTFVKWLQAIYESNMAILGNEQFKMKFNAHYITKFIIAIDEGFLDVDKKAEKERLKQLATADSAHLENKGMNLKKFPYFGKLIICSNDADSVMKIEEEENRWFVVKVNPLSNEDLDPDLELKMKEEIPAFLNFLRTRDIFHPREDRLWFKTEYFITDQFQSIVDNTKNYLEKEVTEFISEMFYVYKQSSMKIDINWLVKQINQDAKWKIGKIELKKFLKEKKKMVPLSSCRVNIPYGYQDDDTTINFLKYMGRPYEFISQDWIDEVFETSTEVIESKINTNLVQPEIIF